MTTGKAIALTIQTFVDQVKVSAFNMLSRFIIAFFPRSKPLLDLELQSPSAVILESKEIKYVTEKVETVTDFILLGSKITVDGDCSHKIKGRLFLERKAMTNLDSVLKRRDIILPTKVHILKVIVFPVVKYGC